MKLNFSHSESIVAASAMHANNSVAQGRLIGSLKAIINLSYALFRTAPEHDYSRAFAEARQDFTQPQRDAGEFIASIRRRLQQPEALQLMRQQPEDRSFDGIKQWLPTVVMPLLSENQLRKLACLALNINPQRFSPAFFVSLEMTHPALYNLLVDEINQAAAAQQTSVAMRAIPQLLRLRVVSDNLRSLHPLLPTVVWAAQILWQISRQGIMSALDTELRLQLHQWLSSFDGSSPGQHPGRLALSDQNLYSLLNNWVERRLSDGRQRLPESGRSAADYREMPPEEAESRQLLVAAEGWVSNSELNVAGNECAELLVKVKTCHEMLKLHTAPVNFATGCPVPRLNHSVPQQNSEVASTQFAYSVTQDSRGQLFERLQIETGPQPFMLSGVSIPDHQPRARAVNELAGPDDVLMLLPSEQQQQDNEDISQLYSGLKRWTEHQLSLPDGIADRVRSVKNPVFYRPGEREVAIPLQAGFFNQLLHKMAHPHHVIPEVGANAWPLPGAAGQFFGMVTLPAIISKPNAGSVAITAEDFYQSLLFKYREELINYPDVTVTLNHHGDISDQLMPLLRALQMITEPHRDVPHLTLNYHPDWSASLRTEVENFASGALLADIDPQEPMNWESAENQYAAWLIGVGLARKSLDKMDEVINKLRSPVWDVRSWINDKINQIVIDGGGDIRKVNGTTPIGVGVRLPVNQGRQYLPLPVLSGQWFKVGDYTLLDIFTREYLRGNYRYESLEFKFPANISDSLKKSILNTDLQSKYITELTQVLSEGDVKAGMLRLFRIMFERAVESWSLKTKAIKSYFDESKIRAAILNDRVFQIEWHGHRLNNMLFIPAEEGSVSQGVIISLWNENSWEVNIDLAGNLSFFDKSKAEDFIDVVYKSMSVKGRRECPSANIRNNQVEINHSGYFKLEFVGKTWVKKTWVEPSTDKSIVSLNIPQGGIEVELLKSFVYTLRADMDYLIKSDAEHFRDSTIEVLNTVALMIGLYVMPNAAIPLKGISESAAKLATAVTNWKTSLVQSASLTIFPNLVKGFTADRRVEAQKAYLNAALGLIGEGGSYLIAQHCPKVLVSLFKQGNRMVKIHVDQLPGIVSDKILQYTKNTFSIYNSAMCRIFGVPLPDNVSRPQYPQLLRKAKSPAPIEMIRKVIEGFPDFLNNHHRQLFTGKNLFTNLVMMPGILMEYLQSNHYQVEIGEILVWGSLSDGRPVNHYPLKVISAPVGGAHSAHPVENSIIEFTISHYKPGDTEQIIITAEEQWLARAQFKDKAVSIVWYSTLEQVKERYRVTIHSRQLALSSFPDSMALCPEWRHQQIKQSALEEIEKLQEKVRKEIYLLETLINVYGFNPETLSLRLGQRFVVGTLPTFDEMGEKLRLLTENPVAMQPVPLPEGDYLLIGCDLRGISDIANGTVTLTDFGAPAALIKQQRLQGYLPRQVLEAGMAAETSQLYAYRVDEFLVHRNRTDIALPEQRLALLEAATDSLGKEVKYAHVPLIIAVDKTRLADDSTIVNNQFNATLPLEALLFVIAPQDLLRPVRQILSTLRAAPIPVSALLIEYSPKLLKAIALAESYALLPGFEDARLAMEKDSLRPWMAIVNLQASSGFIDHMQLKVLRQQVRAEDYRLFLAKNPRRVKSLDDIRKAQPGARCIFSEMQAGPGEPPLSHAMMMLREGAAVGADNQIIGGKPGWQKMYLTTLNWIEDAQYGFVLEFNGAKFRMLIQTSLEQPVAPLSPPGEGLDTAIRRVISLAENHIDNPDIADNLKVYWGELVKLYQEAELLDKNTASLIMHSTSEDNFELFLGQYPQLARSLSELFEAVPGSRIAFTEKTAAGKHKLVHAMIMTYGGFAAGVNNQVLGGDAGWNKIHLAALQYSNDTRLGLVLEAGSRRFNCIIIPPWS